jgi:dTDP-4-amino-4,6-dideoxygalactose transaminase
VLVEDEAGMSRDAVLDGLLTRRIGTGVHYRAVHLHPYYASTFGFRHGDFPHAEYYSDRTISLPLYPRMTDADADDVIAAVKKVIGRYRR